MLDERAHLLDHGAHRHRARVAAPERDDAERAAVVAAVLHLHEGARPAAQPVDQVKGGLAHGHDVVDADLLAAIRAPRAAVQVSALRLLVVADDERHLRHGRETLRLDLRRAAGDDDAGIRPVAGDPADRLPGLPRRLGRHRAGVDDDEAAVAGGLGVALHRLRFGRR